MACIRPVLAGLDGGVPSMRATKSISSIEQKLLKLIESMPVLNAKVSQAASLLLRSNTYNSAEVIESFKADFYRCILTFIQFWKLALKNQMMKRLRELTNIQTNARKPNGPAYCRPVFFDRFTTKLCVTLSIAAG